MRIFHAVSTGSLGPKIKKEAKKELKTGDIKIPMSLCWKCGWMFGNKPLKITKWGHFKDSKWSRHKIETF